MNENAETETVSRRRRDIQVLSWIRVSEVGPESIQILFLDVPYRQRHT